MGWSDRVGTNYQNGRPRATVYSRPWIPRVEVDTMPAMADTPPDQVTAEAPSLANTARWMVILVGTLYLLRELGPILKPLFLAVLVGYIVLPVHLTVKKWVPGRLSLAASGVLAVGVDPLVAAAVG